MSDDPEERLRHLRDAIEDVIEILEGVKERARGFVAKQVEAEKASAQAQSKLDYLKTQLAKQANELATAEGRLAALRSDHVHFIDGALGGYALAASALKAEDRGQTTEDR